MTTDVAGLVEHAFVGDNEVVHLQVTFNTLDGRLTNQIEICASTRQGKVHYFKEKLECDPEVDGGLSCISQSGVVVRANTKVGSVVVESIPSGVPACELSFRVVEALSPLLYTSEPKVPKLTANTQQSYLSLGRHYGSKRRR